MNDCGWPQSFAPQSFQLFHFMSRCGGGRRSDVLLRDGRIQFGAVEYAERLPGCKPDVQVQVGHLPVQPIVESHWFEDVGIQAREPAVAQVKASDVVVFPRECKPDNCRARFQNCYTIELQRVGQSVVFEECDLRLGRIGQQPLLENLYPVRWPMVVNSDPFGGYV